MKTLITTIICISLVVLISCNRKAAPDHQESVMTEMQYIVTLQEGYTMKDLRASLGSKYAKAGPSSKSQNVYLLTLTEEMTADDLLKYDYILEAVNPNKELEPPTQTQSVKKGTSSPIKKNK